MERLLAMKAAIDLDNCVLDICVRARSVLAQDLGVPIGEIIETGIYDDTFTHADPKIAARIVLGHDFWKRPDVMQDIPPMPGAVAALWPLHGAGMLASYVTRRAPESTGVTLDALRRAGCPDVPVRFVGSMVAHATHAVCKSEGCAQDGAGILVDDSTAEALSAHRAGIRVIMVDPPVGRVARHAFLALHPGIASCPDLAAAVEHILSGRP